MKEKDRVKINVEVTAELKDDVAILASSMNVTTSDFIRQALQAVVEKNKTRIDAQRELLKNTVQF